jgi:hypothetical protein
MTKLFFKMSRGNWIEEFEHIQCEGGMQYALNFSLYPHKVDYGPMRKYELKKKRRLRVVK